MVLHPTTMAEPARPTVERFFEEFCPQMLAERREACAKIGGSFAFVIGGEQGSAWFVDLATATVRAGTDDSASVVLEMSVADFEQLLKGALGLELAMQEEGRIRVRGEVGRLRHLASLLDPRGGTISL